MAGCRVVKASMDASVKNLNDFGTKYEDAGTTFVTAFKAAIEDMEGDSKMPWKSSLIQMLKAL